jgi:hypothetical protein
MIIRADISAGHLQNCSPSIPVVCLQEYEEISGYYSDTTGFVHEPTSCKSPPDGTISRA